MSIGPATIGCGKGYCEWEERERVVNSASVIISFSLELEPFASPAELIFFFVLFLGVLWYNCKSDSPLYQSEFSPYASQIGSCTLWYLWGGICGTACHLELRGDLSP